MRIDVLNLPQSARPRRDERVPVGPELAGTLLQQARTAKAAAQTDEGMQYGPDVMRALDDLDRVAAQLADLNPFDQLVTRAHALAFWINLYNALVIHGALRSGVRRTIREVPRFFRRVAYVVGASAFTPDVIEHGLLRANRGHPLRFGVPQLLPGDRRRGLVLRPMDPRVHFALNCGAASCPPIRHYTAEGIDTELDLAARSFVQGGGVHIDPRTGGVLLSRIFLWYARDFGWTRRQQLRAVIEHVDEARRGAVEDAAGNGIRYAPYDWSFA